MAQCANGPEFVRLKCCNFAFSTKHNGCCLIGHNAKEFDAVLIQRWLLQNTPTTDVHVIHSGQKIMQLTIKGHKIRLIHSLNFCKWLFLGFLKRFAFTYLGTPKESSPLHLI